MDDEEKKQKIGWVSRHPPLPAQIRALRNKLGGIECCQVPSFGNAEDITTRLGGLGIGTAVIVAPLSVVAVLVRHTNITWLWAEMTKLHDCNGRECKDFDPDTDVRMGQRHHRFAGFKRIREVRVVFDEWKEGGNVE